jgi:hypothetical protein
MPWRHNLYKEHLAEQKVMKQNRIKCGECKKGFKVKDNEFQSDLVKMQIYDHDYLCGEGVS